MNATDLSLLEALRCKLSQVAGVKTARLLQDGQQVEIPLSRYVAVILEPTGDECLCWPEAAVGWYRLLHWRAAVLDRAVPGTRAFVALVATADACRQALTADLSLGALAEDGPPSVQDGELLPEAGATRLGPTGLAAAIAGQPTRLVLEGATGYWTETMSGGAAIDDESLFASGPHVVEPGTPVRRLVDQPFNGLAGGLSLDLGDGPREIIQKGVLSADTAEGLAILQAAAEAFIDGRTYTLTAPDGTDYRNCRVERFDRIGPVRLGLKHHQAYRITYRQLAR
jgi:hypothetical protein